MANKLLLPLLLLTSLATTMSAPVITPPPPEPTTSLNCHYEFCDGSTSWCWYWAGVSSYDPTLGPLPGERRTSVGSCQYSSKTLPPPPAPEPTDP